MTVKVFRNDKFEYTHENIIFDKMIAELEKQWSNSKELVTVQVIKDINTPKI